MRFRQIELKNFGLMPEGSGARSGVPGCWRSRCTRNGNWVPRGSWLHTDTWDTPPAVHMYERAGFVSLAVRDEPSGPTVIAPDATLWPIARHRRP